MMSELIAVESEKLDLLDFLEKASLIWRNHEDSLNDSLSKVAELLMTRFESEAIGIAFSFGGLGFWKLYARSGSDAINAAEAQRQMRPLFDLAHPAARAWRFPEPDREILDVKTFQSADGKVDSSLALRFREQGCGLLWLKGVPPPMAAQMREWSAPVSDALSFAIGAALALEGRKKLEEKLDGALDIFWNTLTATSIGKLSGSIAHDLNNPLAGILGYTELLQAEATDEQTKEDLEKVRANALRCKDIVQSMLTMARSKINGPELYRFEELLNETLALIGKAFRNINVDVAVKIDGDFPQLNGSNGRMRQMLLQLLLNAKEAMTGGGRLEIRARIGEENRRSWAVIELEDTGGGVPSGMEERIFEPFVSIGREAQSGLGLALCKKMAEDEGGSIELDNRPGVGCTFRLKVPIRP